ncbi:putative divalent heavy-metal cations transporter [Geoglobus ahangari]|uniref:Putative divalent heavy-metal cations transporter n=1 Tax=Geoglobus ahangari TaxID=113653 RepID=A0A0F7IES8_9EURY|nr:ZIP family metal transporter [Geoglobus ahangari]AKG92095.1 putative divalent heavy-metal cations transporter [Geoglobus ahangari]
MLHLAIISTIIVSLVSLVGIFTLAMRREMLWKTIFILVSFAAGVLLGASFFHLLPESINEAGIELAFQFFIAGFTSFYLLERIMRWRHCHESDCEVHPVSQLALIGDSIHNFIDGVVIAVAYITDVNLGILTTFAVITHEIPQELGDFGVLVYGGYSVRKALLYNFLTALTAVAGAIAGYFLVAERFLPVVVAFAAGNFTYIATSDLIPELHKETDFGRSLISFVVFIAGLLLIYHMGHFHAH